jgi:hypothetical protein
VTPLYCERHGRMDCADCRLVDALERGQQPSEPSKATSPDRVTVDEDTYVELDEDQVVFVAPGDAVPLGLEDRKRRAVRPPAAKRASRTKR